MDDLLITFLMALGLGVVGSLIGVLVAVYGKRNDDRLRIGNASGIGFGIGASIGVLIGIFESLIGRL